MAHNAFINTSLRPYVQKILKTFKSDPDIQYEIKRKYKEEVNKILDMNHNTQIEQKYVNTLRNITQFVKKFIDKKIEQTSPKRKVPTLFLKNVSRNQHVSQSKTLSKRSSSKNKKFSKKNLHKLLESNWK